MIAGNFKIGTRFKNKETGHVISVIEEEGNILKMRYGVIYLIL